MVDTGCESLDKFLGGYDNVINMIYGKAATGKTTCCILAAIEQAKKGNKVLYLDTENGFSVERFKQLAKDESLLKNIFLVNIKDFNEQENRIKNLLKFIDMFSLVIIDTIGNFYRVELKKNPNKINKNMDKQLKILAEITRKGIPVLITNQVYTNIDNNEISSVGGNMIKNWCKCLIELKKNGNRKLVVIKPEFKEMLFDITSDGLIKI